MPQDPSDSTDTDTDTGARFGEEFLAQSGGSAVELVATLVQRAVDAGATDIHLEPRRRSLQIRYRVDGFLWNLGEVDLGVGREILSRIKILADMDITERRLPQDGHFRFSTDVSEYDMRISTVPTNFGERMEIRLAEGGRVFTQLTELGMTKEDLALVEGFVRSPHGIVLATGPVGSGKTTTLYSCISKVDARRVNIMTIEDPIEYVIPGANQIEVNYKVDFDFVNGLRAILRQDPNVILVGEIRDDETAKIAIRAGLTGMVVFSTLHANDAVGSVTTLANFQISRFLIANALVGSLAQRLVRRNCPSCSKPLKMNKAIRDLLRISQKESAGFRMQAGRGCDRCYGTGYTGRIGIFEVFAVTRDVREAIMGEASESEIREAARKGGMRTLKHAALARLKDGTTTPDEIVRVLG